MAGNELRTDGTDYHVNPDSSRPCVVCGIAQSIGFPHRKHPNSGWVMMVGGTAPGFNIEVWVPRIDCDVWSETRRLLWQ